MSNLRDRKSNMFATHNSMESLSEYINRMSGSERALAFIIMGITANTVLEILAQEQDELEQDPFLQYVETNFPKINKE